MKQDWRKLVWMGIVFVLAGAPALFAQKYEIHPYAGMFWAGRTNVGELKNEGMYGLKAGIFLDPNFELEGHFGYINHFEVKGIDPKSRGLLWELAGDYNFSAKEWPVVRQFTPFLAVGAGAIRTRLEDTDTFSFITPPNPVTLTGPRTVQMGDGDTFFAVSYGGGIKSVRLWGPLGLRLDIRGRTMPNYYHSTPTWLETTAGINFIWGEK
jgi:hypothetical protein